MSVKETIHQWIEMIPDDSPGLRELYEQAQLDLAMGKALEDVRAGRTTPIEEVIASFEEKCRVRHSA